MHFAWILGDYRRFWCGKWQGMTFGMDCCDRCDLRYSLCAWPHLLAALINASFPHALVDSHARGLGLLSIEDHHLPL